MPWVLALFALAAAAAAAGNSGGGTVAPKPKQRPISEGEIRAQMTSCERIVAKRAAIGRSRGTEFILQLTSGEVDKTLGLLDAKAAEGSKLRMEENYWKAFRMFFGDEYTKYMRRWTDQWRDWWFGLLVKIGVLDSKDAKDDRYDQRWIDQAKADFEKIIQSGVPMFQGVAHLGHPADISESNAPVPRWVADGLRSELNQFMSLSKADQDLIADFWIRCIRLRDGAAKAMFAGLGTYRECPQSECSVLYDGVRKGCKLAEWQSCSVSLQPIHDPQSITYLAARIYASSYGTVVSSAQWFALEDEWQQFWKNGELDMRAVFPDHARMGEHFYRNSIQNAAMYVVAPYNLPIRTFIDVLRIASRAAKRAPVQKKMVKPVLVKS